MRDVYSTCEKCGQKYHYSEPDGCPRCNTEVCPLCEESYYRGLAHCPNCPPPTVKQRLATQNKIRRLVFMLLENDVITEQRAAEELGVGLVDARDIFQKFREQQAISARR